MIESDFEGYPHNPEDPRITNLGSAEVGHDDDGVIIGPKARAALDLIDKFQRQARELQDPGSTAVGVAQQEFVASGAGRGRAGVIDSEAAGMKAALHADALKRASSPENPFVRGARQLFRRRLR